MRGLWIAAGASLVLWAVIIAGVWMLWSVLS